LLVVALASEGLFVLASSIWESCKPHKLEIGVENYEGDIEVIGAHKYMHLRHYILLQKRIMKLYMLFLGTPYVITR